MANGDKYSKARALSRLFEDLVRRLGDKSKAALEMDNRVGLGWKSEMDTPDQGISFLPVDLNLSPGHKPSPQEKFELYGNARDLASLLKIPKDDLEYELFEDDHQLNTELGAEAEGPNSEPTVSDLLRLLADALEKK